MSMAGGLARSRQGFQGKGRIWSYNYLGVNGAIRNEIRLKVRLILPNNFYFYTSGNTMLFIGLSIKDLWLGSALTRVVE